MRKPWDYHGDQPGRLSEPPEDESGMYEAPEPPGLSEASVISEPTGAQGDLGTGPPSRPDQPAIPRQKPRRGQRQVKSSRKSPSVPVALLAVASVVAMAVFFGLRVVRVSISESATGEGQSPSTEQVDQSQEPAPKEPNGSSTTLASAPSALGGDQPDWNDLARSIVFFDATATCPWVGSGTLILDGSYVLTNWHVSGGGECPLRVGLTENFSTPPKDFYRAQVVVWDSQIDLAIVRLLDASGNPFSPPGRSPIPFASSEADLGDDIRLIGYPSLRDELSRYTLTLTDGVVSGTEDFGKSASYQPKDSRFNDYEVWGEYSKHTAQQNGGVSGGAAFNTRGELVGIPTAGRDADPSIGQAGFELMRSVRFAKELANRIE